MSQSRVKMTISFEYEPILQNYEGAEYDGKPITTVHEAALYDMDQLMNGDVGIEEFIDDADIEVTVGDPDAS